MKTRNIIALILILASLACLYPGLTLDILNLHIGGKIPLLGQFEIYDNTQSILQSIRTLIENDNTFVAVLIFLFSVTIPVLKAVLLLSVMFFKKLRGRKSIHKFVNIIGKWSMADVFVVGVFLAFLATASNDLVDATLLSGFYYFAAYCIISIVGMQIMTIED